MRVELVIEPGRTRTWEEFVRDTPEGSVALDGYVPEGPRFDQAGRRSNFNHHEGCVRLATRSTCSQVLLAIRQGFAELHDRPGRVHVYVNDCDEDVCAAVWLLRNPWKVKWAVNPIVNAVIGVNDLLDTTAGTYPFPADMPALRQQDWVMDPYRSARTSGLLDRRQPREYAWVIDSVGDRLDACHVGKAQEISADTTLRLEPGSDRSKPTRYAIVDEAGSGSHWRRGYFGAGYMAYVSHRVRRDGRHVYALGRVSEWVPFPVPAILRALNDLEGCGVGDAWGGGDIVGGSPRAAGSGLAPAEVLAVIDSLTKGLTKG